MENHGLRVTSWLQSGTQWLNWSKPQSPPDRQPAPPELADDQTMPRQRVWASEDASRPALGADLIQDVCIGDRPFKGRCGTPLRFVSSLGPWPPLDRPGVRDLLREWGHSQTAAGRGKSMPCVWRWRRSIEPVPMVADRRAYSLPWASRYIEAKPSAIVRSRSEEACW
jgi:hypothetical protein